MAETSARPALHRHRIRHSHRRKRSHQAANGGTNSPYKISFQDNDNRPSHIRKLARTLSEQENAVDELSIADDVSLEKGKRRRSDSVTSLIEYYDPKLAEGFEHQRPKVRGFAFIWLVFQSIGVIYGDIGTSPLYVYSSTFKEEPSKEDLMGVLSLIIWSLTLVVTIKYGFVVLRADDQGQGGTFALYSLLSRYLNIAHRDPKEERTVKMERYQTTDIPRANLVVRNAIERSKFAHYALRWLAVFGVCLVMADGILTPAQSVLGAVQGLRVAREDLQDSVIIGVSSAVLVCLFVIQPFGTHKVASVWAPIVVVWLLMHFSYGIYNLVHYDHTVLKAFSPFFAGNYFMRNKTAGWRSLGGVLLSFTGTEVMYANLGAFDARSIQVSWFCFGYPCLLMAYIGQAAYISVEPSAYVNPFYNTLPPHMFWPSLATALLAAVVASQAMITATFQLLSQVMQLHYLPKIKIHHTSKIYHGQIYIPIANWVLMVGTIIVTAVYNDTTRLGEAYGTCVILVAIITTIMITVCEICVWKLNIVETLAFFAVFVTLDGLFLSSALFKIPEGAWFPLVVSIVLSVLLLVWRNGKEMQWKSERNDKFYTRRLVEYKDNQLYQTPVFGGQKLTAIHGVGIFFDKAGEKTPLVYAHFIQKFYASHEIVIFLYLQQLPIPSVPPEYQYKIGRWPIPNTYRVVVRHGFK